MMRLKENTMPGPPPKPSALKAAEGNPGHRKLAADAFLPPREPDAPEWLGPAAREVWAGLIDHLMDLGVLQLSDQLLLAQLCDAVAILLEARSMLEAMPFGKRLLVQEGQHKLFRRNPLMQIINDQRIIIQRLAAEFGMSPSSRTRLFAGENLFPLPPGESLAEILATPPSVLRAREAAKKPN
jgi:P27 family predicted phage terminase small subunit